MHLNYEVAIIMHTSVGDIMVCGSSEHFCSATWRTHGYS